jgi:hypothetical protein
MFNITGLNRISFYMILSTELIMLIALFLGERLVVAPVAGLTAVGMVGYFRLTGFRYTFRPFSGGLDRSVRQEEIKWVILIAPIFIAYAAMPRVLFVNINGDYFGLASIAFLYSVKAWCLIEAMIRIRL